MSRYFSAVLNICRMRAWREVLLTFGALLGVACIVAAIASAAFGIKPLMFRSGSMSPTIETGALAFAKSVPATDLRVGDIVSVTDPKGTRVTHRIQKVAANGSQASLTLKGDANQSADDTTYTVASADRVLFSVPKAGYVVSWLSGPVGTFLAGLVVGLVLLLAFWDRPSAPARRRTSRCARCGRRSPHKHRSGSNRRGPLVLTGAALTVVSVMIVTVNGTSGTLAAFTDSANLISTASSAKYFTCDAAVKGLPGAAKNPFLYWKFNEASGATTATDFSTNSRQGGYTGGFTGGQTKACKRDTGTAIGLNGTSQYVSTATAASSPGPNTFTISLWFRTDTARGGKLIGFGNSRTGDSSQIDRHIYMTNDGRLTFGVYTNNAVQTVSSLTAYRDNNWHQAVATLSTAGMRLYVDGVGIAENPAIAQAEAYSGYWRVGFDRLGGWPDAPISSYFAGTVDEAVVYTTALSANEIQAGYLAGR